MKSKLTFWIVTSILIIIVGYSLASIIILPILTKNILPRASVRILEDKEKSDKKEKNNVVSESSDSSISKSSKDEAMKLFELRKREVFLHSQLELANEDSMYLVLDLANNFAYLEMKGIQLHECRILNADISNSIKMYHTESLLNWMAEPFTVKHIDATIPKIVFIEKIAPKDTIEANKTSAEPVATRLGDVFIVMDFDRNLRLVISQSEKPDDIDKKSISAMQAKYMLAEIRKSVQALIKFNREPAMPQISIVIPKTDATIFYKALPVKLKMIIKM
jgi:hypothetical protein